MTYSVYLNELENKVTHKSDPSRIHDDRNTQPNQREDEPPAQLFQMLANAHAIIIGI